MHAYVCVDGAAVADDGHRHAAVVALVDELAVTEDLLLCRLSSMTHPVDRARWRAFVEEMDRER